MLKATLVIAVKGEAVATRLYAPVLSIASKEKVVTPPLGGPLPPVSVPPGVLGGAIASETELVAVVTTLLKTSSTATCTPGGMAGFRGPLVLRVGKVGWWAEAGSIVKLAVGEGVTR